MRRLRGLLLFIAMLSVLCISERARGQGWADYDYPIGNGYTLFRANSMDVCISRGNSGVIFGDTQNGAGPIVQYAVTPTHIYTRHAGRKLRNLFPGDTFEDIDYTKTFFFVLDQQTEAVRGPMTQATFAADPDVAGVSLAWQSPENPHITAFFRLILIVFAVVAALFLVVAVVLVVLVCRAGRRRTLSRDAESPPLAPPPAGT